MLETAQGDDSWAKLYNYFDHCEQQGLLPDGARGARCHLWRDSDDISIN
jgi:hypothetical protein